LWQAPRRRGLLEGRGRSTPLRWISPWLAYPEGDRCSAWRGRSMQSSHMHRHTFEGLFAPQPRTHDAERTQRSRPHRGTGVADPSDLAGSSRKGRASPGRDPHSWSTWAIGCCRSGPAGWRCHCRPSSRSRLRSLRAATTDKPVEPGDPVGRLDAALSRHRTEIPRLGVWFSPSL
jgi:hypothetical protein